MTKYNFLPHPEGESFDQLILRPVERWKESGLSGDEWRFSLRAEIYFHGELMGYVGGLTLQDALTQAASAWSNYSLIRDFNLDEYNRLKSEKCCQPGCTNDWVVLKHPIKRYTRHGEKLERDYREQDVRAFCSRHEHRGDCALDDADDNYVLVLSR